MKKPIHMLTGVNIGDYEFNPETILEVVKKYKFGKENGDVFNFLSLRMDWTRPSSAHLYEWAKYFKENGIYFKTSNNYPRFDKNVKLTLSKEEIEEIQRIAGEYYLGDGLSEFGGFYLYAVPIAIQWSKRNWLP